MASTIIAGSRYLDDYDVLKRAIESSGFTITHVVHGAGDGADGAPGTDALAQRWADENNIPTTPFPADWDGAQKRYGNRLVAGPIRNNQMVNSGATQALVIRVMDDLAKGTEDVILKSRRKGHRLHVHQWWRFGVPVEDS